jgi:hypothetical protein
MSSASLRKLAACAAIALAPLAAWPHDDHEAAAPSEAASPPSQAANVNPYPLPDLSARFKVSFSPAGVKKAGAATVQTWTLTRSADRITLIKGAIEEIWSRDPRGQIGLSRIFRDDRHIVDYSSGELKALEVRPRWESLGTLFDEAAIRYLKPGGVTKLAGREVYRFSGKLGAEQVDLAWDAQARLPARLLRSGPAGQVRFELLQALPEAPAAWPVAGAGSDDFQRIDSADFGDMESDRFVAKAQAYDVGLGWRSAHAD